MADTESNFEMTSGLNGSAYDKSQIPDENDYRELEAYCSRC